MMLAMNQVVDNSDPRFCSQLLFPMITCVIDCAVNPVPQQPRSVLLRRRRNHRNSIGAAASSQLSAQARAGPAAPAHAGRGAGQPHSGCHASTASRSRGHGRRRVQKPAPIAAQQGAHARSQSSGSRLSVPGCASDTSSTLSAYAQPVLCVCSFWRAKSCRVCRIILTIVHCACVCPQRRSALQGDAATSGLKRVTDDMKTKNRADRSGVVPVSAPSKGAAAAGAGKPAAAPRGPARFELEAGRKWVVEHQTGHRGIVIEDTDPKQTVYIYNCTDCTIQANPPACLLFVQVLAQRQSLCANYSPAGRYTTVGKSPRTWTGCNCV